MGQRNSTSAWERIGRVRYKAIADGRAEIAVFLNTVLLFMEKKATADQLRAERDRLLASVPSATYEVLLFTIKVPKHVEKVLYT